MAWHSFPRLSAFPFPGGLPAFAVAIGLSASVRTPVLAADAFKWGSVVMGGGGFVSGIVASKTEKNLFYARTDVGGAYRWNEAIQGWIPITDWLGPNDMGLFGIDALALDPSAPGRVYMLAGTEYWNQGKTMILRSSDYGETFDTINVTAKFKTHGNGYGRQNGERLAVDPNQPDLLLCGTRADGLWKSEDKGSTWTQVTTFAKPAAGDGIGFVIFDKTRAAGGATQRIFLGTLNTGENLFVSDDAGKTWQAIALPVLSKQVMPQRAVLSPGGRYLYVTVSNGSGPGFGNGTTISRGAVLKYATDAKTWENISPENSLDDPPDPAHPGQTLWDAHLGGFGGISMDAADSNHLIVASINNWKPQIWEGSNTPAWGDKIFASADGGKTWKSVFGDLADDQIATANSSSPIAVLGKNGYGWIEGESIHWAGSIEFDPFNPKRVFVTSGNGIYMTQNLAPGQRFRWDFCARGLEETVPFDIASIPGGPVVTVIGDYDGYLHRDINLPPATRHTPKMGSTTGLDFAKSKPNILVRVGGNDKSATDKDYVFPLYYSTDTGKTWTKFATHPEPGQNQRGKIAISSDGSAVLWNPEQKSALYRTTDWGATWSLSAGASGQSLRPLADPVNPNVFYVFGNGVLKSTDKGATFAKVDNANFSYTTDFQATPGKEGHLWVTGYSYDGVNGGYLARSTDGGKTFVKIDPAEDPAYTQRIQHSEAVGFGKAAPGAAYPAIYMYGTIAGALGLYQSIDEAKTWARIDDAKHRFGSLANGGFVRGDANTFGVVYRSTAGRGIVARMPSDWTGIANGKGRATRAALPWSISGPSPRLDVLSGGSVRAEILDLRGRRVASRLVMAGAPAYLCDWVPRSGAYLIRLRAPGSGVSQAFRATLLK
jgi:xyloglucan-specific exo-beta-1,4-glucanase